MRGISQSSPRLFCALLLSLALHGGVFYLSQNLLWMPSPPPLSALRVQLGPPVEVPPEILKNTIQDEAPEGPPEQTPPARGPGQPEKVRGRPLERLMERLSDTLSYPAEAVEQGLEGEVVLILSQDMQGRMTQIIVASSSGHALLDETALRAVRELRTLGPEFNGKTWLFPVTFELK